VYAWTLGFSNGGVVLVRAEEVKDNVGMVTSIDAITDDIVDRDPLRVKRQQLSVAFPGLASRLRDATSSVAGCVRECQARRCTQTWSLDDFDSGDNMSNLGLTVLMTLCVTAWVGARARVFVSENYENAFVGIWSKDEFRLFDCTDTRYSAITLLPHFVSFKTRIPRKNDIIEVLRSRVFRTCIVVKNTKNICRVFMIKLERMENVDLNTCTWRFLQNGTDCDISSIVIMAAKDGHIPSFKNAAQ
jgi:hypothetical protein